jgi:hypothetical protein
MPIHNNYVSDLSKSITSQTYGNQQIPEIKNGLDEIAKEIKGSNPLTQGPYSMTTDRQPPVYRPSHQRQTPYQEHNQADGQYNKHNNDFDNQEIKRLRRKILRMEDTIHDMDEKNRGMQQPMPIQPQQQDKTMYYLLLIIGSATFLLLPIAGIPILAAAIGMSCGFKDNTDINNYLNAVHQNEYIRNQEINDLRRELRGMRRDVGGMGRA